MSTSEFATWVLQHLDLDTWFDASTLRRRLAGIHGQAFSAPGLLGALCQAGWVEAHPTYPSTYCLASRCWLKSKKPASATN